MDDLMEGMVGEGSLMRQAIKDLTSGRATDNPTMMKEKEFGIISENMKKLLDVKAKLVALSMDTSSVDIISHATHAINAISHVHMRYKLIRYDCMTVLKQSGNFSGRTESKA